MLIRFAVENFMSFKEQQVFSMVAGKHTRHPEQIILAKNKRILKGSFIFGANASGKSNFIKAISMAKDIISKGLEKAGIERRYFRLTSEYIEKPGVFQFDIFSNGKFYSYGFAFSYKEYVIVSEWLYHIDNDSEILIFDRNTSSEGLTEIRTDLEFDDDLRYRFKIYGEDVPKGKTFLSDIAEKEIVNSPDFVPFKDVWTWFKELVVIFPDMHMGMEGIEQFASDKDFYNMLMNLDTGIKSISIKEGPVDEMLASVPERIREKIRTDIEHILRQSSKTISVLIASDYYSFHMKNGEIIASKCMMDHGNSQELFSFADESDGTKRLFDLLPFAVSTIGNGVILIDEIDRSFHTKLIIRYIELFFRCTADMNIQLIATLHDVNLMNFDIIRQDEIWFVYRDGLDGSSHMYSLNKFQIRYDKKIIKDYLLGRFGSIPFFGQDKCLGDDNE